MPRPDDLARAAIKRRPACPKSAILYFRGPVARADLGQAGLRLLVDRGSYHARAIGQYRQRVAPTLLFKPISNLNHPGLTRLPKHMSLRKGGFLVARWSANLHVLNVGTASQIVKELLDLRLIPFRLKQRRHFVFLGLACHFLEANHSSVIWGPRTKPMLAAVGA